MSRWLAGTFDRHGSGDPRRLAAALAPDTTNVLALGDLNVAYTGAANDISTPLCLLDGFIDNTAELCSTLGEPERSSSTEQLLANAYRRWGPGLPVRLRGDFALLIWDPERGEGVLARDQLGVRSMFLHEAAGRLSFATEIRQLLALLPSTPGPDPTGLAHWVTTSGRPGNGTLYEGIRRLSPGSMLLLDKDGVREQRYWTLRYVEPLRSSAVEIAQQVKGAISDAVSRRLSPDGLTGVLMSGGLDSSTVAATASELSPDGMRAYSAEFPDHPAVDESELIDELRRSLRLPGVTATVHTGGLLTNALEWIDRWKVPLTSWGEFWCGPLLEAGASAGVRTVLGGDGGDELFGCRAYLMADRLRAGHPRESLLLARELPGAGDHPSRRALLLELREHALMGSLPARIHQRFSKATQTPSWLRPEASRRLVQSLDPLAWKRLDGPRWWAHDAYALTQGVEQLGLFENHRRRTAALELESRHPIFDLDLLELCMRQSPRDTFNRYHDRPVLRSSMQGLLPDSVRLRPAKALFDSLLMDSLSQADGAAARKLLSSPRAELAAYVDIDELGRSLLDSRPESGPEGFAWSYRVWRLLTAECWLRLQAGSSATDLAAEIQASAPHVRLRAA